MEISLQPRLVARRPRPHPQRVHERARQQRKENIEQEARVRFQPQDACADAEEGGGEVVQRGECLVCALVAALRDD